MSFKKFIGSAALSATVALSPLSAMAHTNTIGYVGDGSGSVTFWYGNWHPTASQGITNEGEIKLEGINGTTFTTEIVAFDQYVASNGVDGGTTPDGLVSGVNLFQSNGTELVPVGDPSMVQQSVVYAWQGATFDNLEPGEYRFTYVPLGDPDSQIDPSGTPSMDWQPADQVIRTSTFTLTPAALAGEVVDPSAVLTVTSVTRVPQGKKTTTQVTYTTTENDGEQNVEATYRTTEVTTIKVTTSLSDGSEVVTYEASVDVKVTGESFSGAIDQIETLDEMTDSLMTVLNRNPDQFDGEGPKLRFFENNYFGWSDLNGYDGNTTIIGGGVEFGLSDNWVVGVQYNDVSTTLDGNNSESTKDGDHIGVFSEIEGEDLTLLTNAGILLNEYSVDREVGEFSNTGDTTGTEWWVSNRVYVNTFGENFTPFIGYNYYNNSVDGYTEDGFAPTAREVDSVDETKHEGEVGVVISTRFGGDKNDLLGLAVETTYETDNDISVLATADLNETIVLNGFYRTGDNGSDTGVSAAIQFSF